MTEHATCCAECAAQELAQTCDGCAVALPETTEHRFQFVLEDAPRFAATMTANAARVLLVLLSRKGQAWRAVEV